MLRSIFLMFFYLLSISACQSYAIAAAANLGTTRQYVVESARTRTDVRPPTELMQSLNSHRTGQKKEGGTLESGVVTGQISGQIAERGARSRLSVSGRFFRFLVSMFFPSPESR